VNVESGTNNLSNNRSSQTLSTRSMLSNGRQAQYSAEEPEVEKSSLPFIYYIIIRFLESDHLPSHGRVIRHSTPCKVKPALENILMEDDS
jgi:hypothetical protein